MAPGRRRHPKKPIEAALREAEYVAERVRKFIERHRHNVGVR